MVKVHFTTSHLKEKHVSTKNVAGQYKILRVPPLPTPELTCTRWESAIYDTFVEGLLGGRKNAFADAFEKPPSYKLAASPCNVIYDVDRYGRLEDSIVT